MPPFVAEDIHHKIGRPINHCWLITKVGSAVHEATEFEAGIHMVKVAVKRCIHLRQNIDGAESSRGLALLNTKVNAHLTQVG